LLKAGGEIPRDDRRAREAIVPRDRHSALVEAGGDAVEEIGPIHVVLDVFLARPHDLDGALDLLRDLHGARDTVALQAAPKTAADQMIVDDDLVERQSRDFRGRGLAAADGLVADPHFAAVAADMHGAVHRLERCMREKRNLILRLDLGDGARHRLVDVSDVLRDSPRFARGLLELAGDVVGRELRERPVIPFDDERGQSFLRGAHVIGDDGDGIVEADDLAHALDGFRSRVVHALHATAEDRRLRERCDLHAGRPYVDAVHGRSVDLRRRVEALQGLADQLEVLRLLERNLRGDRKARRVGGKLAVAQLSPGRFVNHHSALRATGRRIDVPAVCRGRDEHRSRGCAGFAHRLPCAAYRIRVARRLYP
jgi:hypothetical protein